MKSAENLNLNSNFFFNVESKFDWKKMKEKCENPCFAVKIVSIQIWWLCKIDHVCYVK